MAVLTPGNHPGTGTIGAAGVRSLTGYLLKSIDDFFIISNDGFYIDLGGSTTVGGIPSTGTMSPGGIGNGTLTPGNTPSTIPYTPGS